jgi:valyl-tRNA synthetase
VIHGHAQAQMLTQQKELIANLKTGLSSIEIKESGAKIEQAIIVLVDDVEVYLLGAIDEQKEKERLLKEKANLEKVIGLQEAKLNNSEFTSRAPEKIVALEREKLKNYQGELQKITKIVKSL